MQKSSDSDENRRNRPALLLDVDDDVRGAKDRLSDDCPSGSDELSTAMETRANKGLDLGRQVALSSVNCSPNDFLELER